MSHTISRAHQYLLLALLMCAGALLLAPSNVHAQTPITTWAELAAINTDGDTLAGEYILVNDLGPLDVGYDEYAGPLANEGDGWAPIGPDVGNPFIGTFDGNEQTISGLYIDRTSTSGVGLFGRIVHGGSVYDLTLEDVDVAGQELVGGLAGFSSGAIWLIEVSGDVSGTGSHVGGLVGYTDGTSEIEESSSSVSAYAGGNVGGLVGSNAGMVEDSFATGDVSVTAFGNQTGGLIGSNSGTTTRSYATGDVDGQFTTGGLVGQNTSTGVITESYYAGEVTTAGDGMGSGGLVGSNAGLIDQSYASSAVIADGNGTRVGGLVGDDAFGTITNSYARGVVQTDGHGTYAAGLVATLDNSSIDNTYAAATVAILSGSSVTMGGLIGSATSASVADSFYDLVVSAQSDDDGRGTPTTTAYMKVRETFTDAGWDFDDVWGINGVHPGDNNDGYPFLRWQDLMDEEDIPVFTLTFNTQGGAPVPDPIDGPENRDTDLPAAPTRVGYTFVEWNTAADGSGDGYAAEATIDMFGDDTTLYAIWLADEEEEEDEDEPTRRSSSGGVVYCSAERTTFCRERATPTASATTELQSLVAQHRDLFLEAHRLGIALPQYILDILGLTATSQSVRDLELGDEGNDVRSLQAVLIALGHSIPSGATGYFGGETQSALIAYQSAQGITPAVGYFGPTTRAHMKRTGVAGLWW